MQKKRSKEKYDVQTHIVNYDSCIGCGICELVCPENCISFTQDIFLSHRPIVDFSLCDPCGKCIRVCPDSFYLYKKIDKNMQNLEKYNHIIGHYKSLYYAHATDKSEREQSSSGGVLSLLLKKLLKEKKIEGAIVVRSDKLTDNQTFAYADFATLATDIDRSKGSKYVAVKYSDAIKKIKQSKKPVAIVATPCVASSIHKLKLLDKDYDNIKYIFSFTCGHITKPIFAKKLIDFLKVFQYDEIRFRSKKNSINASDYSFEALHKNKILNSIKFKKLYGQLWSSDAFTEEKCLRCDDIFAKYADICVMDAWGYSDDKKGQSFVVTRNDTIEKEINELKNNNMLNLFPCEEVDILNSQPLPIKTKYKTIQNRISILYKIGKISKYSIHKNKYLAKTKLSHLLFNLFLIARVKISLYLFKNKIYSSKLFFFRLFLDPHTIVNKIKRFFS